MRKRSPPKLVLSAGFFLQLNTQSTKLFIRACRSLTDQQRDVHLAPRFSEIPERVCGANIFAVNTANTIRGKRRQV
jgi:hypothetical protein